MARRRFEIGEMGKISRVQIEPGRWRAKCRVRCRDGRLRLVQADATSGARAETAVIKRAAEVAVSSARGTSGAQSELLPTTTVRVLAETWISRIEDKSDVAPQTVAEYRRYVLLICGGLGDLQLREVTPGTLDWFVSNEAPEQASKSRMLRMALRGMFSLAIRMDAYDGSNPAAEVSVAKSKRDAVRALTFDELRAYRERIREWEHDADRSPHRGGRRRARGMLDVVDIQLATGTRIGELLALRWSDIDLEAVTPTATISGTVVRLPGSAADGGGLVRQPHPKTDAGWRTVSLPGFAVATLMRMKVVARPNPHDVVFPSERGTLRDPHNVRRQLRDARGEQFAWVKPHTFRKTVATLVEREASLADAAAQLGHSGTDVTTRHYVQRAQVAPDLTRVLDLLAPGGA
ncbi:site-specific integrase [Gordonia sp. NPDC003585]|uniref:tyrosine-type recombinase/integrase n=1 Tax=Gordonia sp. NPDC003585 TaxID=3154275 RepID=UPI0033A47DD8